MTEQEKSLLLKDLCARLPYGVICQVIFDEDNIFTETLESVNMKYINQISTSGSSCGVECVKPYLRSMSSMTDEEKEIYESFVLYGEYDTGSLNGHYEYNYVEIDKINDYINWLNANHFDFRNLIGKGLALEAPKDMYNLK